MPPLCLFHQNPHVLPFSDLVILLIEGKDHCIPTRSCLEASSGVFVFVIEIDHRYSGARLQIPEPLAFRIR